MQQISSQALILTTAKRSNKKGAESERSKYMTRKIKEFTEDVTKYDAQTVMEIFDMI